MSTVEEKLAEQQAQLQPKRRDTSRDGDWTKSPTRSCVQFPNFADKLKAAHEAMKK